MEARELRNRMVEEQLAGRGIKDKRVLDAFRKVERHKFIPSEPLMTAYGDYPVAIGDGQTISQPYIVALMTELLNLSGKEKVLEIGTGSGYQTAILAELAGEVFTIERFRHLSENAQLRLTQMGYSNCMFRAGDGTFGWPQEAPFDRILITAAANRVPVPIEEELKEGGRLVLPLGARFGQVLNLVEKNKGKLDYHEICGCVFVPLVGKFSVS